MEESKAKTTVQLLNIAAFLGTILVNYLANAVPLGGRSTGEISELYPNLFTPAGYTFAIWGLIYLLLALFVIYQAKDIHKLNKDPIVEKVGGWFFVASLANMAWIFAWHYLLPGLSLLIMLVLLVSLIMIYLRLGIGREQVSVMRKYLVHLPFSVYLGWISVATIANVSAYLVSVEWGGWGLSQVTWTVIVIIVGTLIALNALRSRGDVFYSLVFIWAFIGIFVKRVTADVSPPPAILLVLVAAVLVLAYVTAVTAVKSKEILSSKQ